MSLDLLNLNDFLDDVVYTLKEKQGGQDMTILDFIDKEVDRELLGIQLNRRQRLLLKCFYGLYSDIDSLDLEILEAWSKSSKTTIDINNPKVFEAEYQSLVVTAGRRAGKSLLGSIMTAYEFYRLIRIPSPQSYYKIAGSTPISLFVIATAATQSKRTIFKQTVGILRCIRHIRQLESSKRVFIGEEEIRFEEKMIYIYSGNSQSSSQVGQSVIFLLLDEVARFKDKDGNSNALQLWSNLGISGVTFGKDARRVAISSAWYVGDAIQLLYQAAEAEPSMVGFDLCSWDLNPEHASRDNPIVAAEYALDPIQAALEFENKRTLKNKAFFIEDECRRAFRGKTSVYYEVGSIIPGPPDGLVRLTVTKVLPKASNIPHSVYGKTIMHLDPAVTSDSYALAFGHDEYDKETNLQFIYVDGLASWDPDPTLGTEVSITNVQEFIYELHAVLNFNEITADHYNSAETIQRFKASGINSTSLHFSNSLQVAAYKATRDCLHEDRLVLPANSPLKPKLLAEMLDVRLMNNGKKVDHGPNGSKDLIDCVCIITYRLSQNTTAGNQTPDIIQIPQLHNNSSQLPTVDIAADPRLSALNVALRNPEWMDLYPEDTKQFIRSISSKLLTDKIKGKFYDL